MRQIFASVAYCHAHSIAHRDLKPENYLLHDKDRLSIHSLDLFLNE